MPATAESAARRGLLRCDRRPARGQRNANGIANAFLQQHAQGCARSDNAFRAHASFGQAEVQGIIAARSQRAININQVLHSADFGAQNDLIAAQSVFLRQAGGIQRAHHHGFHGHFARVFRLSQQRILVHHARQQRLVERSPVHADTNRLLVLDRDLDHGAEVVVVFRPMLTLPGLMRYLASARAQSGYFLSRMCPL